jgi:hypothetical protein
VVSKAAAQQIHERLDQLEAERLILTIELRCELLRAAKQLLPEALRQAQPRGQGKARRAGSPALLRLISRLAMRRIDVERPAR